MKNKELIELLSKFDLDLNVLSEGCDCYGDTEDVEFEAKGKDGLPFLLIVREKGKRQ